MGVRCSKPANAPEPVPAVQPANFSVDAFTVDGIYSGTSYTDVKIRPQIRIRFGTKLNTSTIPPAVRFNNINGSAINTTISASGNDSVIIVTPENDLEYLTKYTLTVATTLKSSAGGNLLSPLSLQLQTPIDSSDKFPRISDDELLDLVQRNTLKYFTGLAHPVSGMARERSSSGDIVTTGGTGFGIMAIITGIHRGFISRSQGVEQVAKIASFLKNNADKYHGAFAHWINGSTGATVPFSTKDNGADIVETSLLMQGLLCAREYFQGSGSEETNLRQVITELWEAVEWNWFTRNNEEVLYWHWSDQYNWDMNLKIKGWNECLITYVLAASSPSHPISASVYDKGWASEGGMKNGNSYYGYTLPLGPVLGGPLFWSQYSFMGINPIGLKDKYADYQIQNTHHALINYNYCEANPKSMYGYSEFNWGLTASDIKNGYAASSPTNDLGYIAPTAPLSSFPYTPEESMKALKFFYYTLGDRIWKEYGFTDAFSLKEIWFSDQHLAIDQGPIIVMIENYRSGLLWNLLSAGNEVRAGLKKLGFTAPYL